MLVPVCKRYVAVVVPRDSVSLATALPVISRSRRTPENVRLPIVVPGLNCTVSVLSTCPHGVPFAPDLLLTPIESVPSPGDDAVPVEEMLITGDGELIPHELFAVVSVCVEVPNLKYLPLLPRWRRTALGSAPPLVAMATAPIVPVSKATAATTRSVLFSNMVRSRPYPTRGLP